MHKISFIAQDMTDSRAFGYIFGSPDTGHRFFGIKTDKAASQVSDTSIFLFRVILTLRHNKNRRFCVSNYVTSAVSIHRRDVATSSLHRYAVRLGRL